MKRSVSVLRASVLSLLIAGSTVVAAAQAASGGPAIRREFYRYSDETRTHLVGYGVHFCDGTTDQWGIKGAVVDVYTYDCP